MGIEKDAQLLTFRNFLLVSGNWMLPLSSPISRHCQIDNQAATVFSLFHFFSPSRSQTAIYTRSPVSFLR